MVAGYKIRYFNDYKGHGFEILRVINNNAFNIIDLVWWLTDVNYKHHGTIGQWQQKKKKI